MNFSAGGPTAHQGTGERLNGLLAESGLPLLESHTLGKFESYLALLLRWNLRVNLTAIRDQDGILKRHFVESIACAKALPSGITTLLDLGSGGGFPGIPIALCRPEISVTLAESQGKKAAFLQETVRTLQVGAVVYAGRAENLKSSFDCVALRAVDRMEEAVHTASGLIAPGGWLALLTTEGEASELQAAAGLAFTWVGRHLLPYSQGRLLLLGKRL